MRCPKCNSKAGVADSRPGPENTRRRRYVCSNYERCDTRFSTLEEIEFIDHGGETTPAPSGRLVHLREKIIQALDQALNSRAQP